MDIDKIFDTSFNYMKIAEKGTRTDSIPNATPTTVVISHGLGYIPSVRVWFDPAAGKKFPIGTGLYSTHANNTSATVYLTTSSLVITYSNTSGSSKDVITYYRIYYEP